MLAEPLSFPRFPSPHHQPLEDEPSFHAARHLALEMPSEFVRLSDLGYTPAEAATCATDVAITAPFRVFSDAGVAAARAVAEQLKPYRKSIGERRIASYTPAGVYRSAFLRDYCGSPALADFLTDLAGTPMAAHTLPMLQVYVNFAPEDLARAVDNWHADSIGFSLVVMISDPAEMEGGKFQYFKGTTAEASECFSAKEDARLVFGYKDGLPPERMIDVTYPAPGYGILMQGSMVVHRGAPLTRPGARTTFVSGFVARDVGIPDPTNTTRMQHWGQPTLLTELARHGAWRSRAKLDALISDLPFTEDRQRLIDALRDAVSDAEQIIADMEAAQIGEAGES